MTTERPRRLQRYVSISEARLPDCAQFSFGMSSKITIVASGVVWAMFTIASVITLASSCYWACVRPVHISTRTTGMFPSVEEYGIDPNLVCCLATVNRKS